MGRLKFKQIIIISLSALLALMLTRLEVFGFKIKTAIYPMAWVAAGFFMYRIFRYLRGSNSAIRRSTLGIAFPFYVFGTFFLGLQFVMCGEGQTGTKYVSLKEDDLYLECRSYKCFQTTGSCQFTKVRTLLKGIYWVTNLDRNQVDLTKWKAIPNMG
jgi:hypothetical protein